MGWRNVRENINNNKPHHRERLMLTIDMHLVSAAHDHLSRSDPPQRVVGH
jgi:hypothetical protein